MTLAEILEDYEEQHANPTVRDPDVLWLRPTLQIVKCWIVELGRPHGVRVDWQIDGVPKESMWFPTPTSARRMLDRWRRDETKPGRTM